MGFDPIREAWEESEKTVSWEEYLKNRNESSKENGYKDAYEEYFSQNNK